MLVRAHSFLHYRVLILFSYGQISVYVHSIEYGIIYLRNRSVN